MDLGLAGAGDVPTQLTSLYNELAAFCRDKNLSLHLTGLTRTLVGFAKDADFPFGHAGISQYVDYGVGLLHIGFRV